MKRYTGEIKARVVEVRFALSGKIARVTKTNGDKVKKGELLASLDRKILQMELDSELADYEKVRADWDSYSAKFPDPQGDDKYTKAEKQAVLNVSVKQVELVKARLDQADLFSPVDGVVIDDSGIIAGLYVTPASSSMKIIDTGSYYFEFEVTQKDIAYFEKTCKCKVKIEGVKETVEGETSPVFADGKRFSVKVTLSKTEGLLMGMSGQISF